MSTAVGLTVTLRVRMGAHDARRGGDHVDPARILDLFGDVAAELLVRLDGDEGILRAYEAVEFLAPVRVGEFVEATGVLTEVGATTRSMAFEARKVVALAGGDFAPSAADALAEPAVVCRAIGTSVVPHDRQRRPRLVLPALAGPPPEHARLPEPRPIVTPAPHVIVTPPNVEVVITASLAVVDASAGELRPAVLAAEAARCREAGAAVVLLCPRAGGATRDQLASVVAAIREATDVVVGLSTWGGGEVDAAERAAWLACRPDLATLACGAVAGGQRLLGAARAATRELALRIRDAGAAIELECRDAGHLEQALELRDEKVVPERAPVRFVLGVPGGIGAREEALRFLASQVPPAMPWGVAAEPPRQHAIVQLAMRLGGHVRVGAEHDGRAASGGSGERAAELAERAADFARSIRREVVEPARARALLGVPARSGGA